MGLLLLCHCQSHLLPNKTLVNSGDPHFHSDLCRVSPRYHWSLVLISRIIYLSPPPACCWPHPLRSRTEPQTPQLLTPLQGVGLWPPSRPMTVFPITPSSCRPRPCPSQATAGSNHRRLPRREPCHRPTPTPRPHSATAGFTDSP